MSAVSDSIAHGAPLSEEPGLGALTIPGYLREVTTTHARREALVLRGDAAGDGRDVRWSYAELWRRSLEVARALRACGVDKGARIGILMTNRPEFLAAAFGTSLAGGVIVGLNTFSTPAELAHQLAASDVSVLLFERRVASSDFAAVLVELEPAVADVAPGGLRSTRFPFLRHLASVDAGAAHGAGAIETWPGFLARGGALPESQVDATAARVTPADAGAVFFSSGTTSRPKGVLHSQRAIAIQWWRWGRLMGMRPPVRSWTPNGFFWSGNFSMVLGGTLTSGGSLVLQRTFDTAEALALMQSERVSFALAWPHQWAKLEGARGWRTADLGSLRYVMDDTPAARHPTVHTSWLSPPSYGSTETLTISTGFAHDTPREIVAGSHGEPLPGNALKIVDPLTGDVLPRGARGEIAVRGPTLMLGYLGIPRDEALDADGFFHTGDGGFLDAAGRLYWEGRLSDVVKTGGANVSPREIDEALLAHPGVRLSQSVGVPHETLGEMVVSCIVLHDGVDLGEDELRAFARHTLASYKVPRRVLFFREGELEKTGTDKVRTGALRELCERRLARQAEGEVAPAPRNPENGARSETSNRREPET